MANVELSWCFVARVVWHTQWLVIWHQRRFMFTLQKVSNVRIFVCVVASYSLSHVILRLIPHWPIVRCSGAPISVPLTSALKLLFLLEISCGTQVRVHTSVEPWWWSNGVWSVSDLQCDHLLGPSHRTNLSGDLAGNEIGIHAVDFTGGAQPAHWDKVFTTKHFTSYSQLWFQNPISIPFSALFSSPWMKTVRWRRKMAE